MNNVRVRAFLAILVVGVFMLITGVMAIYPLVSETKVALNDYADFFAKTASVYTGIIGVIIGYYFGRADDKTGAAKKSDGRNQSGTSPSDGVDSTP